jgi:small ligand-binding sensory domain FIST
VTKAVWKSSFSTAENPLECVAECLAELSASSEPTVVFFFVSDAFSPSYQELFEALQDGLGDSVFLGGSASGLAGSGQETEFQPGLTVLCGWLPDVQVHPFYLDRLPDLDGPPEAWRELVAGGEKELKGIVLLADPFTFEAENVLAGLDFAYPETAKVGGLVSGCQRPGQAALFCGRNLYRRGCVGLAFTGAIHLNPAVCQGCQGFGKQYVVTKCERHILLELSGMSATDALGEMLEGLTLEQKRAYLQTAIFIGLGAGRPALQYGPGDFLVRQVVGADEPSGALVVGTQVRQGQTVQFHLRNRATSRFDLESVLTKTVKSVSGQPQGALLFSCLGRGESLYGVLGHDSKAFARIAGDLPLCGFFCNGEIGPVGGVTSLHGFTSSFVVFSHDE